MNQTAVKKIRKTINEKTTEVLLLIRKEYGKKTEDMNPRQVYKKCKKLYREGKFKV